MINPFSIGTLHETLFFKNLIDYSKIMVVIYYDPTEVKKQRAAWDKMEQKIGSKISGSRNKSEGSEIGAIKQSKASYRSGIFQRNVKSIHIS